MIKTFSSCLVGFDSAWLQKNVSPYNCSIWLVSAQHWHVNAYETETQELITSMGGLSRHSVHTHTSNVHAVFLCSAAFHTVFIRIHLLRAKTRFWSGMFVCTDCILNACLKTYLQYLLQCPLWKWKLKNCSNKEWQNFGNKQIIRKSSSEMQVLHIQGFVRHDTDTVHMKKL